MRTLEEKYGSMNINQYEAINILWKKIDEIVEWCNEQEKIINQLQNQINNK